MKDITYSLDEIIEIIKKITDKNYYGHYPTKCVS